jgi:hypothetical protein
MWCNPVSSPMLSVCVTRPLQSRTSIWRVPASSATLSTTPSSSVPFTTRSVDGISPSSGTTAFTYAAAASFDSVRARWGRQIRGGAVAGRHSETRRDVRARSRARSLAGGTMRGGTPAGVLRRRILSTGEPSRHHSSASRSRGSPGSPPRLRPASPRCRRPLRVCGPREARPWSPGTAAATELAPLASRLQRSGSGSAYSRPPSVGLA